VSVPAERPVELTCLPVDGIGEVAGGADLAALLRRAVELRDGDILVVTSKVVSKAEGRVRTATREDELAAETDRTVARRGRTSIVRTRHGLVLAAAGIDASNTEAGTVVLLPLDPDGSATRLREALAQDTAAGPGHNVAVLVSDTAGRAWRQGQTDIAVGAAGLQVLHDHAGLTDAHGNELAVTAPAVADELAGAADLVKRKLTGRPAAVIRGLGSLVLPPGQHGPGSAALVRAESEDMFGLGAREAVVSALLADDARGFGAPAPAHELVAALTAVGGSRVVVRQEADAVVAELEGDDRERGALEARLQAAAFAHGWRADAAGTGDTGGATRHGRPMVWFRPVTP
jgi:coenzyme F420-0:L-glutamate ligase/coenzyme F420-1:gamma-L-glutamate ligase